MNCWVVLFDRYQPNYFSKEEVEDYMGSMTDGEQENLMDQLEQFLPTLAAHPVGFIQVVAKMIQQFQ